MIDSNIGTVNVLGINITPLDIQELHWRIYQIIVNQQRAIIANVNVHGLNIAYKDLYFREFLNSAEIVFCDGAGVIFGAHILGHKIPERITFADWTWKLAAFSEENGFSIFLLGAKPGVAEFAADKLSEAFPNLEICGSFHGYFDKTPGSPENQAVVNKINKAKPNILLVSFGMPLQERWLKENWENLNVNIALPAGAALDYISGCLKRPPRWMTGNGMEWLGRLLIEPGRLWKRYLIGNPLFLWRIILQKLGVKTGMHAD